MLKHNIYPSRTLEHEIWNDELRRSGDDWYPKLRPVKRRPWWALAIAAAALVVVVLVRRMAP